MIGGMVGQYRVPGINGIARILKMCADQELV